MMLKLQTAFFIQLKDVVYCRKTCNKFSNCFIMSNVYKTSYMGVNSPSIQAYFWPKHFKMSLHTVEGFCEASTPLQIPVFL